MTISGSIIVIVTILYMVILKSGLIMIFCVYGIYSDWVTDEMYVIEMETTPAWTAWKQSVVLDKSCVLFWQYVA